MAIELATRDVAVDLKARQLASQGPVAGADAARPVSRRGSCTPILATVRSCSTDGARLKIVQGAVR